MNEIKFECGRCRQPLVVEATGAGQTVTCPQCGNAVVVPGPAAPPALPPAAPKRGRGLAIAALVLGLLGLIPVLGIPLALAALILGIVALVKRTAAKGCAITGVVLGALMLAAIPVYLALLVPWLHVSHGAAQQVVCLNNLKQIGLALTVYQQDHGGQFPADLQALVQSGAMSDKLLHCPVRAAVHAPDAYEFQLTPTDQPSGTMLAWDAAPHRAGPQTGRCVLMADLSVRFMQEGEFQQHHAQLKKILARRVVQPSAPTDSRPVQAPAPPTVSQPETPAPAPAPVIKQERTRRTAQGTAAADRTPVLSAEAATALVADLKSGDRHRLMPALIKLIASRPETPQPEVAAVLAELLAQSDNIPTRINAAWALEHWGTAESLPALQKAGDDANPSVRSRAKRSIEKIKARP